MDRGNLCCLYIIMRIGNNIHVLNLCVVETQPAHIHSALTELSLHVLLAIFGIELSDISWTQLQCTTCEEM